jgi:hypothetical protein
LDELTGGHAETSEVNPVATAAAIDLILVFEYSADLVRFDVRHKSKLLI